MKTILTAGAVAALNTGTAQAATVVDEIDRRSTTAYEELLSFDGYQGSGTVVQVDVTFFADIRGTIDVRNNTDQEQDFSAGFGTISGFYPYTDTSFSSDLSVAGNTGGTIRSNESFSVELSDSANEKFTFAGEDITEFLDPFDIYMYAYSDVAPFDFDTDLGFSFDFQDSFSAEVAYSIDDVAPVPLPSTLPMLLAGLGGFSYFARRRQHSTSPEKN